MRTLIQLFIASLFVLSTSAHSATLVESGGQLVGVNDVNVNGTLYNMVLVEGSCATLFDDCDEASDFTFQNSGESLAASQNLAAAINNTIYDSDPELIFGCSDLSDCTIRTGHGAISGGNVPFTFFLNRSGGQPDLVAINAAGGAWTLPFDSNNSTDVVLAKWTVIPLPAAAWLFLGALCSLLGLRRRMSTPD